MQSVLSEFLAAGLRIGEEDEKLRLLESAAGELVKKIKGAPLLLHRFALQWKSLGISCQSLSTSDREERKGKMGKGAQSSGSHLNSERLREQAIQHLFRKLMQHSHRR
jgi:hypothetical protein